MPKGFALRYVGQMYKQLAKGNFDILQTYKFYSKWKESLLPGRNSIVDEQPWITFPVVSLLNQYTNANSRVFEYGGGGSTLFFVNRAKEVVTVEHDEKWFLTLQNNINNKNTGNWSGNLVLPEKNNSTGSLDPSKPQDYFSKDPAFTNNTFSTYSKFIDQYPNDYFDIVLVDGRARPSCAWQSIPKIKKGGFLIIDNSDRDYYFMEIKDILKEKLEPVYNKINLSPYVDFFTHTGVWKKL